MVDERKLLLIGGASHVGKSTLAQSLASHIDCNYYSTDKLARHPGRPWQSEPKDIPQHVAEHYQLRSIYELIDDVIHHYNKNVWSLIEDIVTTQIANTSSKQLIIEGSVLLPELVITLKFHNISSIWLTASNEFLKQRIYAESQYETKSIYEKLLIDKFWERNCLDNDLIIGTIDRLGLVSLDIEKVSTIDELMKLCLSAFFK